MKNVYLYIVFLLLSINSFGQGTDVIFLLDNSRSISDEEFLQMKASVGDIASNILDCGARISVIHYWENKIYIESDFASKGSFNNSIQRRGTSYANVESSLGLIGDALDGVSNNGILSLQKTLTQPIDNPLVIYLFTDDYRGGFVNLNSSCVGCNAAFTNCTTFKQDRIATFVVTWVPPMSTASSDYIPSRNAAATIASGGGSYTGSYESYPADPDAGSTGRYLLIPSSGFILTASEIDSVTSDICSVEPVECSSDLILTSPIDNVLAFGQDNRQASKSITASNIINNGGTGIYHAGREVVLKSGFHSASGSKFRGYIQGCSDHFVGLKVGGDYESMSVTSFETKEELFTLYPNPASESVTIASDKVMQNITVTSLDGFTLFQGDVKRSSFELNISNYRKGIYVITVVTEDGNMEMKKLIKE